MGTAVVEALATQEPHARRVAGQSEAECMLLARIGADGVHGDLVSNGQGGQHAAAPHDHTRIGLPHYMRPHVVGTHGLSAPQHITPAQRVQQSMSENDIVFSNVLAVGADVPAILRLTLTKVLLGRPEGGHSNVHEVGAAPHHARGGPGPVEHHAPAGFQFFHIRRRDEREAHGFPRCGRAVGHLVVQRRVVLHIVEAGHGADVVAERRMRHNILHPLPVYPHVGRVFLEPLDILSAGESRHGRPPASWLAPSGVSASCFRRRPPWSDQ